jgi:integrase
MTTNEITVRVVEFSDRKNYQFQWLDPTTEKKKTKASDIPRSRPKSEASKAAGVFQAELNSGNYAAPSKITWEEFRQRYETEKLPEMKPTAAEKSRVVLNRVEEMIGPKRLSSLTESEISRWQAMLLKSGCSKPTIASYLGTLKAALRWAARLKLINAAPVINSPRKDSGSAMKGCAFTSEEFERMLDAVPAALQQKPRNKHHEPGPPSDDVVLSWRHYLRGLWLSGLRLTESINLTWDDRSNLVIDMTGKRPMFRIPGEHNKNGSNQLFPIAPDFAEFLLETPEDERTGFVFNPLMSGCERASRDAAMRTVAAIGEQADVVAQVHATKRDENGKSIVKYATAHDFRRSFGTRWSLKVKPIVLMRLMRHRNIETTMRYYIGQDVTDTAEILWEVHEQEQERQRKEQQKKEQQ